MENSSRRSCLDFRRRCATAQGIQRKKLKSISKELIDIDGETNTKNADLKAEFETETKLMREVLREDVKVTKIDVA